MPNAKRILEVRIIRAIDTDADTSYLGEYGNSAKNTYAIDRYHSEDCASVAVLTPEAEILLSNARAYIADVQAGVIHETEEWEELEEAYVLLDDLINDTPECDCGGHNVSSREYRYFNPCWENYEGETEEDIRKYCRQDYDRMESLNNQNWYYLGIRAEAQIQLGEPRGVTSLGNKVYTVQTIQSGGLWGIESDSDKEYIKSVEQDELSDLRGQLKGIGFSTRAISTAFKSTKEVSE